MDPDAAADDRTETQAHPWRVVKNELRRFLPPILSRLPHFRGKGRVTLALDRILTDEHRPSSYEAVGVLNDGHRFAFDLRPWGQKFAYYYRDWEIDYVRMLRRLYAGGVFLDIGSSLGLYVVCLGEVIRRAGGFIVSIEPVTFNIERQKRNIALNGLEDIVRIIPVALGDEQRTVRLSFDPLGADNNAIIATNGTLQVPLMPLDALREEFRDQRVGLVKIDVEGYEPKVIAGGRQTIERDRPILLAEFNRERMRINRFDINEPWRWLVSLGYRLFKLERGKLRELATPGEDENLFFLPADRRIPEELLA